MLRETIRKIIREQCDEKNQKQDENKDLYQMILDEITKLQDVGIKNADEHINNLKKTVDDAEAIKQKLVEQYRKKGRLQDQ